MGRGNYQRRDNDSGGGDDNRRRRSFRPRIKRKKQCSDTVPFDYKKPESLRQFVTSHGRIKPKRLTGLCTKHQRVLAREIKRARHLALLPFESE